MGNVASPNPRWTMGLPLLSRSWTSSLISSVADSRSLLACSVRSLLAGVGEPIFLRGEIISRELLREILVKTDPVSCFAIIYLYDVPSLVYPGAGMPIRRGVFAPKRSIFRRCCWSASSRRTPHNVASGISHGLKHHMYKVDESIAPQTKKTTE